MPTRQVLILEAAEWPQPKKTGDALHVLGNKMGATCHVQDGRYMAELPPHGRFRHDLIMQMENMKTSRGTALQRCPSCLRRSPEDQGMGTPQD